MPEKPTINHGTVSDRGMLPLFFVIFFCSSFISIVWADDNGETGSTDLLDLSLEQLATITVVSKKQERIQDAPGVVTVITADEIKRYGARNLRDVLDRQTSMQVIGSNLWPHNKVSLRGVASSHVDNNVLILINNRPIREASVSSFNYDIYGAFPLDVIKQIEIIRGPGSVLYGTNAMSGVINIVTRDYTEALEANVALTYGSFDTRQGQLSGSGQLGGMKFYGAVNVMNNEGDVFENVTDETATVGDYKTGRQGEQLVFNASYKNFTLNMLQSDTDTDAVRSVFIFPSTVNKLKRQFVDIGYKSAISDRWDLNLNASYHHHTEEIVVNASGFTANNDADNGLLEISALGRLSSNVNVIAGATRNVIGNNGDPDLYTSINSLYGQFEYQANDRQKWIGGLQYNKPEEISGHLSPRLATIIKLNDHWHTKLLYSQAFRDASPVERYVDSPVIMGNPSLKPELISTFDAQLLYEDQFNVFSVTYFHSIQSNLIVRSGGTPLQIINAGGIHYNGIELEGQHQFSHDWQFTGNLSYQTNENDDGERGVTYAPDLMLKAGVAYASRQGYALGIFDSYFAESALQNQDINPSVANVNPDAEGYNQLSANLRIDLARYLPDTALYNPRLSFYVDNLLDEEIYFPSISRTDVNTLPHHAGRGIYATLEVGF